MALSRARSDPHYRFIPIISAGAEGSGALPAFARQYQGVLDVENRPDELAKLIRAAVGETAERPVQLVEQPFPGLRAFDEEQTHLFFGRESETEALVEKLRREPLLMVVGDSGSGKSSLVRTGVMPRFRGGALADLSLDQPDDTIWHVVIARPRGRPFDALADAVFQSGEIAGSDAAKLGKCKDWIRTRQPAKVRDGLIHSAPTNARILLVIDQFEELLTQAEETSRQPYIEALLGLVADPGDRNLRIVMTMRYDYYNLCSQFPTFFRRLEAERGRAKYSLERMSKEGLRACIREPLKLAGLRNTETLASEIVRDIGERPGNLALMQMALKEAWQKRTKFNGDLLEAYVNVGRVTGALANTADEVFKTGLGDQQRQLAEIAFVRLVRLGDTGGTTRRTATRDGFSDDAWAVVQKLATEDCRRLVFIGGEPGHESVELAHEALATQWPRYQTWLQQAADDKRWLDRLIDRAERWRATGEKVEGLATGTEREELEGLAQARASWLAPAERRFVQASADAYREEQKRKEEARLREVSLLSWLKRAAVATATVAILAVLAGGYAWVARDAALEARNGAQFGDSLYRAEQARQQLDERLPVTAMQLALAGLPQHPDGSATRPWEGETVCAWLQALGLSPSPERPWVGDTAGALLEAMAEQRESKVLRGHEGEVWAAGYSRAGDRIVSGGADGTVRLWDAASGEELLVLRGHEGWVRAAGFSPAGDRIVSGGDDGTVRLWDAGSGKELLVLRGHENLVRAAAFSPAGDRIVSGADDNTVRVWDAANDEALLVLRGHEDWVRAAGFSPAGDRIVSGGGDGTVRLWDAASGEPLLVLRGHEKGVRAAGFSPAGDRIVSGGADGAVRLWDAASGEALLVLRGHEGVVLAAGFSPAGDRIVSGGGDHTVRVWDAASGEPLLVLRGHEKGVRAAGFSPAGDRIVSAGADGTVRLWDAASGEALLVLRGHEAGVSAAGFSPAGDRIVSGGADSTVRLWDAASGEALLVLRGHAGGVWAAGFSPAGDQIVSGSEDGTVRVIWVPTSKQELIETALARLPRELTDEERSRFYLAVQ